MVCHGISGPGLGLMLGLVVIIGALTLLSSIGCGFQQSFSHQNRKEFNYLMEWILKKHGKYDCPDEQTLKARAI